MINNLEFEKESYLNLLKQVDFVINRLDGIVNKLNKINFELKECYTLNDSTADNQVVENKKNEINQMRSMLKNNVYIEIIECMNQIQQKINMTNRG